MTSNALRLLLSFIILLAQTRGDPLPRAKVTIKFNCLPWANDAGTVLPCDIRGACTSNVSVCFSHKRGQPSKCEVLKDFSKNIAQCGNKQRRSEKKEVFRLSRTISNTSQDLFFNVFRKRSSMNKGKKTLQVTVRVLPYLRAGSEDEWVPLASSPSVEHFLHVSGRLTCLPTFSGPRCQDLNQGLLMSPGEPAPGGINLSLETILAAIAAGCCVVMLLGLSVWCCVKRRTETREERGSSGDPYLNDVYELPYEDLEQNRASYVSVGLRDSAKDIQSNGNTLESMLEEGPELPPRRVSISSEDICSRGETEEEDPFL